jgi:DNA polymerase III delta prime subunit
MTDISWLEKYKPQKITDIIGNKTVIKELDAYIKSVHKGLEEKHIIMISGETGVGKSLLTRMILEKYNYRIIELDSSNLKDNINTILNNTIKYKNVLELFMNDNRKSAVIIEEIESMNSMGSKSNINDIIDIIKRSEKKNNKPSDKIRTPIILTCNKSTEKKIMILRKLSKEFVLKKPTNNNITKFLDNIINKENIIITPDEYKQLIINSNRDVRSAILLLNDVHISTKNNIKVVDTNRYNSKDTEIFLYSAMNDIFTQNLSYEVLENIYYTEPFLVPLMIHENYINILINTEYKKDLNKLDTIIKCSRDLITSDMYNSNIIMNQYYDIQEYMPYYSNVPINREFMKYKPRIFEYDINYSGLFNKLSQKTNKKIKIVSLVLNISNPVVDYCDSSQLILMCIYYIYKHNNYNYLKELIGYYKLTYDQLEQIVKFYTKMGFNMKLKKEIKELF